MKSFLLESQLLNVLNCLQDFGTFWLISWNYESSGLSDINSIQGSALKGKKTDMGSSATTEQFQPWALCGVFFAQLMSRKFLDKLILILTPFQDKINENMHDKFWKQNMYLNTAQINWTKSMWFWLWEAFRPMLIDKEKKYFFVLWKAKNTCWILPTLLFLKVFHKAPLNFSWKKKL